jgi:hypothetical protein
LTRHAPDRERRRRELVALLVEVAPRLDPGVTDDTPLISSGLVESATLLHLALWVEQRIDAAVDITSFDLAAEWDTVGGVLGFVERHRAAAPRDGRSGRG